jgi:hypothetical protein
MSVQALNDSLDALSHKVTACVKAGGKAETCQCSYPQDLASLRKSYASLIKQHPDWKDQLLSYRYVTRKDATSAEPLFFKTSIASLKC